MAGDWLKMDCSTPEKPEVLAITARLGWDDPDMVVGKLFRLWRWFDQHTTDGNAAGVTSALLDRVVGVSGFCDALSSVGWLEVSAEGVTLPNFDKHNGNTAKNRAQTAKRVANHKEKRSANALGNGASVSDALPREEKRREEIKEVPTVLVASASPPRLPPCPTEELLSLYHERCPTLGRVSVVSEARKRALGARWREIVTDKELRDAPDLKAAALDWWAWFFDYVNKSDFLTGRAKSWKADFDWLVNPTNFAKVVDGNYHKEAA